MKNRIWWILFVIATIIKFSVSLVIAPFYISLIYSFSLSLIYSCLIVSKVKLEAYVSLVMIDFICGFYLCFSIYGLDVYSILFSIIYFVISGGFLYFLLIDKLSFYTSNKHLTNISNINVDKGIKALEDNDYNKAIEAFSKAIKEHKTNYLGYMGMCNTLTKIDKKDLKKIQYYKKKCIKYAPEELKESINDKY